MGLERSPSILVWDCMKYRVKFWLSMPGGGNKIQVVDVEETSAERAVALAKAPYQSLLLKNTTTSVDLIIENAKPEATGNRGSNGSSRRSGARAGRSSRSKPLSIKQWIWYSAIIWIWPVLAVANDRLRGGEALPTWGAFSLVAVLIAVWIFGAPKK